MKLKFNVFNFNSLTFSLEDFIFSKFRLQILISRNLDFRVHSNLLTVLGNKLPKSKTKDRMI